MGNIERIEISASVNNKENHGLSVENVSNRYTPDKSTKFGMGVP